MDKKLKLLIFGICAFCAALAVVLFVLSSVPEQTESLPIPAAEKINTIEKDLKIKNSSFDAPLIEIPANSFVRLKISNMDLNRTHHIVLLQPYSTGLYSVIERRSIRSGRYETITFFNYRYGLSYDYDANYHEPSAIADELIISCTTCKTQTLAKIVSKKES